PEFGESREYCNLTRARTYLPQGIPVGADTHIQLDPLHDAMAPAIPPIYVACQEKILWLGPFQHLSGVWKRKEPQKEHSLRTRRKQRNLTLYVTFPWSVRFLLLLRVCPFFSCLSVFLLV